MSLKDQQFQKKGIGIESQIYANNLTIKKLQKQDGTQSYGCYRRKVNSKAFAIPILTIAVRIGIANALELTFLL